MVFVSSSFDIDCHFKIAMSLVLDKVELDVGAKGLKLDLDVKPGQRVQLFGRSNALGCCDGHGDGDGDGDGKCDGDGDGESENRDGNCGCRGWRW